MKTTRKLKIWNGRDWAAKGMLYVAAYSVQDAVDLVNAAYRKLKGYENRPDIGVSSVHEVRKYWAPNCWGDRMAGIPVERGVWHRETYTADCKPVRLDTGAA